MRTAILPIVLVSALGLGGTARAQATSTPFAGSSGPVQFKILSLTDPNTPIAAPMSISQNTSPQRFFNSNVGNISNSTNIGVSHFPSQLQLPGNDYLKAFNIQVVQPANRRSFFASPIFFWNWF